GGGEGWWVDGRAGGDLGGRGPEPAFLLGGLLRRHKPGAGERQGGARRSDPEAGCERRPGRRRRRLAAGGHAPRRAPSTSEAAPPDERVPSFRSFPERMGVVQGEHQRRGSGAREAAPPVVRTNAKRRSGRCGAAKRS